MNLIDMHCDTVMQLFHRKGRENLKDNQFGISIPRMRKAGTLAQFFACFTCVEEYKDQGGFDTCYDRVLEMIALFEKQMNLFPGDIAQARTYEEIMENKKQEKISAVLTVEEGGVLNGEMERLDFLYQKGVRLITLMWNYENCLGYPNSRDQNVMQKGLTSFGADVVRRMGELGMIVDVSHASDGSFYDVLGNARGPVVASHSNCRALCSHPRNLTDEMIRDLANAGGVAGLNFYGAFLGTKDASLLEEMTAHVQHMVRVGGSDFPAIGTDFDGFDGMKHLDIPDASHMEKLWDALKKSGLSERQLDKIWSENVLRIFRSI
ncbi:dipeptidase [Faecalicatena contorta]|uniref:dipeptidase n=1 Tax=Faecalicatena contorta TaxID=39482 RepID=UPI001F23186C|nr:dipeptidase [Faecalicatena contorta]MCF2555583.1 dipeptidase [Faecalicatena contorta]